MAGQLVYRLKTELDRAEADTGSSLLDGRVKLPQRENGLTVVLGINGHCGAKACWVVVDVGPVVHDESLPRDDLEVVEAVREHSAITRDHVEASTTAWTDIHLSNGACEAVGAEPLAESARLGPRSEPRLAWASKTRTRTISRSSAHVVGWVVVARFMSLPDRIGMSAGCGCVEGGNRGGRGVAPAQHVCA